MRWRPLGFRTRLTIRLTLVFSGLLAAASLAIYFGIRASSYADLDRHLRTLAATEVASAFDRPVSPHVHDLPATVYAAGAFTEKLVQVYDDRGNLVVASQGRGQSGRLLTPSLLEATLAGDTPLSTTVIDGLPVRLVVLKAPYQERTYAFAVGVVIVEFLNSLERVKWLLAAVWLISSIATAAVVFALASTVLLPVRRITERALEIAGSDLRARLEPAGADDEMGAMTRALNTLLDRLHKALDVNRRFAADAAHELRSPVTAMAGEIDVALRRQRSPEEYRETLHVVRERLTAFASLIGDLMLLVRAQETRSEIVSQELSLETLVQGSIARVEAMARAREVTLSVADLSRFAVYGEAGLLARVFDNVIENAVRYNRRGGSVTLTADSAASVNESAGAPDSWEPARVSIRVIDIGTGIPAVDSERVFTRFYRVDESRNRHTGGAGLGLAIAREILELFKGTISIERSSDEGTTMLIRLPGSAFRPEDGHLWHPTTGGARIHEPGGPEIRRRALPTVRGHE